MSTCECRTSVIVCYYINVLVQSMKPNRTQSGRQVSKTEDELFKVISSLKSNVECRNLLKDLCTPAELQALADRWQVVKYLQKKLPYREIHNLTGVSVTTIGRVARCLSAGYGGYKTALKRHTR